MRTMASGMCSQLYPPFLLGIWRVCECVHQLWPSLASLSRAVVMYVCWMLVKCHEPYELGLNPGHRASGPQRFEQDQKTRKGAFSPRAQLHSKRRLLYFATGSKPSTQDRGFHQKNWSQSAEDRETSGGILCAKSYLGDNTGAAFELYQLTWNLYH